MRLTAQQTNIYNLERYIPGTEMNNLCSLVVFGEDDPLDVEKMNMVLNDIVAESDVLHIHINTSGKYPQQYLTLPKPCNYPLLEPEEPIEKYIASLASESIDLTGDLYSFSLIKSTHNTYLFIKLHHIIADGASLAILTRRIMDRYEGNETGEGSYGDLETLRNHLFLEETYLSSKACTRDTSYFAERIAETVSEAEAFDGYRSRYRLHLSSPNRNESSPYINNIKFILKSSACSTDLTDSTDSTDCHDSAEASDNIGGSAAYITPPVMLCYAAAVCMHRLYGKEEISIGVPVDMRGYDEKGNIGMYVNTLPLSVHISSTSTLSSVLDSISTSWLELLKHNRYIGKLPAFDIVISYQDIKLPDRCVWTYSGKQKDRYIIHALGDDIYYDFTDHTAPDFHRYMTRVLETCVDMEVKDVEIFDSSELADIYIEPLPGPYISPDAFMESNIVDSDICCIDNGRKYTYGELKDRAEEISHVDLAILRYDRSFELLCHIYSCIVSHVPFLLIPREIPDARVEEILTDVRKDEDLSGISYILYTSGTTGKPKGVKVREESLLNLAKSLQNLYSQQTQPIPKCKSRFESESRLSQELCVAGDIGGKANVLSITNTAFDAYILESAVPLMLGCTITIGSSDISSDIARFGVTHMVCTPSRFMAYMKNDLFRKEVGSLARVILGGEKFPEELVLPGVVNQYGLTETCVAVTMKEFSSREDEISCGHLLPGCGITIVNPTCPDCILPFGYEGEICIYGICVSEPYMSGDLGYLDRNGELHVTGRKDRLVKVRGIRLSPDDISVNIERLEYVKSAYVDKRDERLICWYEGEEKGTGEIRKDMLEYLPSYMIPTDFIFLSTFPLTDRGKIDSNALPYSHTMSINITPDDSACRGETGCEYKDGIAILTRLLSKVLGHEISESVSFLDAGGDSLKAIELSDMIRNEMGRDISPLEILQGETACGIYEILKGCPMCERVDSCGHIEERGTFPMTGIQKGIYVECTLEPETLKYNMPGFIDLPLTVSKSMLKSSIEAVILGEPSFKMCFRDGLGYTEEFSFNVTEGPLEVMPFNLSIPPLIRVSIDENRVYMDMHHIISDGKSTQIILRKIQEAINGEYIPSEEGYQSYARRWNDEEEKRKDRSLEFFRNYLSPGYVPAYPPAGYTENPVEDGKARVQSMDIGEIKVCGCTRFSYILNSIGKLVMKLSAETDVTFGVVFSDRKGNEEILGPCINTLPVRIREDDTPSMTMSSLMEISSHADCSLGEVMTYIDRGSPMFRILVSQLPYSGKVNAIDTGHIKSDMHIEVGEDVLRCTYMSSDFSDEMIRSYGRRLLDELKYQRAAVIYHDLKISKEELMEMADTFTSGPEVTGIHMERCPEMIAAILHVINTGGTYVPMPMSYPEGRIQDIIKQAGISCILTRGGAERVSPIHQFEQNNIFQVLFTSGSTGRPKGVMIERESIDILYEELKPLLLSAGGPMLCSTDYGFDTFITESIFSIWAGIPVVLADDEEMKYPWELARLIQQHNVHILQMTPSRMNMCLGSREFREGLSEIKVVLLAGEKLTLELLKSIRRHTDARIINLYGPTEATVYCTYIDVTNWKGKNIPIGYPVHGANVYIDSDSIGEIGEILIEGRCLAKDYAGTIYHTGDMGLRDERGRLYFVSRRDRQLKLNGQRVELEEIEAVAMNSGIISDVCCSEDMVLTYVAEEDVEDRLREYLKEYLPPYMLPGQYINSSGISRTPSGKLIRSGVKADVWKKVLGLDEIEEGRSFFSLGGNSIKALEVLSGYREAGIEMTLKEFYENPYLLPGKVHKDSLAWDREHRPGWEKGREKPAGDKVLITGASGFLGAHVLRNLLENDRKVICLVRSKERLKEALSYYFSDDMDYEYEVIEGDICKERLGLGEEDYLNIAMSIDTIYHIAGDVRYYAADENEIYMTNARGTEEIVHLALKSGAFLRYASTASKGDSPYILSKRLAEEYIFSAAEYGLRYRVYRVGRLVGRMSDGRFQMNPETSHLYLLFLHSQSFQLIEALDGTVDITPVDMAADILCQDEREESIVYACSPWKYEVRGDIDVDLGEIKEGYPYGKKPDLSIVLKEFNHD